MREEVVKFFGGRSPTGPRRGRGRFSSEDVARVAGVSIFKVRRSVTKGELVVRDFGSVVEWIIKVRGLDGSEKVVEFEKAKEGIG